MAVYVGTGNVVAVGTVSGNPPTLPSTGTLFFWFYPTFSKTDGVEHSLFDARKESSNNYFTVNKFSNNELHNGWYTSGSDQRIKLSSGSYTLNQNAWNSYAIAWTSAGGTDSVVVAVNGSINTQSGSLSVWDTSTANYGVVVGNVNTGGANHPAEARFAEVAIWNAKLGVDRLAELALGISPAYFKPNRIYYAPFIRNSGAANFVEHDRTLVDSTNTSIAAVDHCRIIYPAGGMAAKSGSGSAAVGGPWPFHLDNALAGGLYAMGL